ncbi:MAG: pyruvate kinase [Candidatus Hydrothermarchaeales archaeon]
MVKNKKPLKRKVVKSKIVCTIGPASESEKVLSKMIDAGMDVTRLNFSHGTHEKHLENINLIRKINDNIAILCDIQGPKIRTGTMKENTVLERGQEVTITTSDSIGDKNLIPISYKGLPQDVNPEDLIFINDGLIKLQIKRVEGNEIVCDVIVGGEIRSRKGVNIPSSTLSITIPTEKDRKDLEFIAGLNIEYVAASFVGTAAEVDTVREILGSKGDDSKKIISKIERPIALKNFDEILMASDGIMVARGDLGVEIPPEQVPKVQKELIHKCNSEGRPVIVATQMLESMTYQSTPTRAEASDAFNAVLDGADAVMLSGETATGLYPVQSVELLNRIVETAENVMPRRDPNYYDSSKETISEILGHAVYTITGEFDDLGIIDKLYILAITKNGHSAKMVSKYRPPSPIIAATPNKSVLRQLQLQWGVDPILFEVEKGDHLESMVQKAVLKAMEMGFFFKDDYVAIISSSQLVPDKTNVCSVFAVKDIVS